MSVRNKLLRSSIVLTLFYLTLGLLIYSFSTHATINYWANKLGLNVHDASGFDTLGILFDLAIYRASELYPWLLLSIFLTGTFLAGMLALKHFSRRINRAGTKWKSVSVTLSEFPSPVNWSGRIGNIEIESLKLKGPYQSLMNELISFAMEHEDHFIGHGHGDSGLLKHTVSVIEKALARDGMHKLLPIAAAAHDLGKVKTFELDSEGDWIRTKPFHDIESAKILKSMPSWDLLPEPDRRALYFAVKYEHHPESLPTSIYSCSKEVLDDAKDLLNQLRIIDGLVSGNEAELYVEKNIDDIESSVISKVNEFISVSKFITKPDIGHENAVGFTLDGNVLFIIEHALRSFLVEELAESISTPLGIGFKRPNGISQGTLNVLEMIDKRGGLVKTLKCGQGRTYVVESACPLWDVKVGDIEFKALIALVPSKDFQFRLPIMCEFDGKVLGPYKLKYAKIISSEQKQEPQEKPNHSNIVEMKSRQIAIPSSKKGDAKKHEPGSSIEADKSAKMPDNDMPPDLY